MRILIESHKDFGDKFLLNKGLECVMMGNIGVNKNKFMGQKVHPYVFRLGMHRTWWSRWFTDDRKRFTSWLHSDLMVRHVLERHLREAGFADMRIAREKNSVTLTVYVSKAALAVGKKGEGIEKIKKIIAPYIKHSVHVHVKELKNPDVCASSVALSIARQLEKRVSFRSAMRRAMRQSMASPGVKGVRIACAGRLDGSDIARTEWYREGCMPLHTLRAHIDYSLQEAHTIYGTVGVKVWVNLGTILERNPYALDDFNVMG